MTPESKDSADKRREPPAARDTQQPGAGTPSPDMQSEDAGSTDSGTAASRAMKQTSKTPAENKR